MATHGSVQNVKEAKLDEETLLRVMESLDIDGDGKITKDELKVPWKKLFPRLSDADYDSEWKKIDSNGDGELQLKELAKYYGFDLSKKKGEKQEELSDEKILEALQLQATLAEMQAEQEAAKQKQEEEKKKSSSGSGGPGGSRRGSSTGGGRDRERKKSSSGVTTVKMPAKVTEEVKDENVIFMQACELGDEKKCAEMLKASPAMDGRMEDDKGEMPLHKLSRHGCMESIRDLIDRSSKSENVKNDLNWQDKQGKTPIFYAAEYGQTKLVDLYLTRGAEILLETTNGWTVLHAAVNADKYDVVERILDHPKCKVDKVKKQLLEAPDKSKRVALHIAAFKSREGQMVELLLKHGADPHAQDASGNTGAKLAGKTGRRKSKELLEESMKDLIPGSVKPS